MKISLETLAVDYDLMPSPTGAKTLAIIDLLATRSEGLTATEATRESGITGNLVFRILKTLVEMGFATLHAETKTYALSNRLLNLSSPRIGERSLVLCAHLSLCWLRDQTGETVQLLIESAGKAMVLEQVQGKHALQVCGQVGMRVPLYSCAPGKAILAWWDEPLRKEWFRNRRLKRFTSTTLDKHKDLEADLNATLERGFAIDRAEGIEGIHCVAAPILSEYGRPLAAITVMAPVSRMPEESFASIGKMCIHATREIEHRLRY